MRSLAEAASRIKQILNRKNNAAFLADSMLESWPAEGSLRYNLECAKLFTMLWDESSNMPERFRRSLPPGDTFAPFFLADLHFAVKSISETPPLPAAELFDITEKALLSIISNYKKPENVVNNLITFNGRYDLAECVRFIRVFRFTGLEEECCQLMITLDEGGFRVHESEQQQWHIITHEELIRCLSELPPDTVPGLWNHLKDPSRSSLFWPILDKLHSRDAVPYLLKLLPDLPLDGQNRVIGALHKIGDIRAVPTLQIMAADKNNLLALSASRAVAAILKNSPEDAAQLLRASDSESAPGAKDTLLRASGPSIANKNDSAELLRHSSARTEHEA